MRVMHTITPDPYSIQAFKFRNKLARALWWLCYVTLFRISPKPLFRWRRFLLCLFGAKLGRGVAVYPRARIWAPWLLQCDDMVAIANDVEIYNPSLVSLGSHAIISQGAYLCGATHDYDDPDFPLISKPIIVGNYAWVCARSTVMPGVTLNDGTVLGLGSIATRDLKAWSVYAGLPAKFIKERKQMAWV